MLRQGRESHPGCPKPGELVIGGICRDHHTVTAQPVERLLPGRHTGRRVPLASTRRPLYGTATIVMLVVLRLAVGWHFLYAGLEKLTSSSFTADGFLSQAKGPFAEFYHGRVHDWEGRERLNPDFQAHRMADYADRFEQHYHLSGDQAAEAQKLLAQYQAQAKDYLAKNKDDILTYKHELDRLEVSKADPTRSTPFQQKRIWDKQTQLRGQLASWTGALDEIFNDFQEDLADIRDARQRAMGPVPLTTEQLFSQDNLITAMNIAVGGCLLLGLFTRLASLVGGAFLLSIVLAQPDWPGLYPVPPPSAGRTFLVGKEFIEMVAMFLLATTPVGRWGGLDFFIHNVLVRPFVGQKEST